MRLIDADALIAYFNKEGDKGRRLYDAIDIFEIIDTAPTIEAEPTEEQIQKYILDHNLTHKIFEPVKRGKWIYDNQFHWYRAICSECGYIRVTDIDTVNWNKWRYCPNCGAKMFNEKEEVEE